MSSQTPTALGYRMPAEWEPHTATWLSWPRREGISFPESFDRVLPALRAMVEALVESEQVCINVCDRAHEAEEHTSELQSLTKLVCRLLLEKKKKEPHNKYLAKIDSIIYKTDENMVQP